MLYLNIQLEFQALKIYTCIWVCNLYDIELLNETEVNICRTFWPESDCVYTDNCVCWYVNTNCVSLIVRIYFCMCIFLQVEYVVINYGGMTGSDMMSTRLFVNVTLGMSNK